MRLRPQLEYVPALLVAEAGLLPSSGVFMKGYFCTLLVLVVLVFGLSLAVQAEDVPQTPYDETEELPCESTPQVSVELLLESARTLQESDSSVESSPRIGPDETQVEPAEHTAPSNSNSLAILNHCFRC